MKVARERERARKRESAAVVGVGAGVGAGEGGRGAEKARPAGGRRRWRKRRKFLLLGGAADRQRTGGAVLGGRRRSATRQARPVCNARPTATFNELQQSRLVRFGPLNRCGIAYSWYTPEAQQFVIGIQFKRTVN